MGERVALAAVCALAAAMPGVVLGVLERELPVLAATMDAAAASGRTAGSGPVTPSGEQIPIHSPW